jgi:hypothetical protein
MVRDTSASAAKYTANTRHVKVVQGFGLVMPGLRPLCRSPVDFDPRQVDDHFARNLRYLRYLRYLRISGFQDFRISGFRTWKFQSSPNPKILRS